MNTYTQNINVWDFVEKFYPGYSNSDEIAQNDDLHKLVDNEFEDDDSAHRLLIEDYGYDIKNPQIKIDCDASDRDIFEKSIEKFLELQADATAFETFEEAYAKLEVMIAPALITKSPDVFNYIFAQAFSFSKVIEKNYTNIIKVKMIYSLMHKFTTNKYLPAEAIKNINRYILR